MDREYIWQDRKRTLFGLPLSFTKYALTEDRLFISRGLFNLKQDEVRLYRIMDVSLRRSLGQRMFGVGSIHCSSADKTMGDFVIQSIKDSEHVMEILSSAIEKERFNKRVSTREFMTDGGDFDQMDMGGVGY